MSTATQTVRDAAFAAAAAGLCVVPPREDGTKSPHAVRVTYADMAARFGPEIAAEIVSTGKDGIPSAEKWTWKHWQYERPTRHQLEGWYGNSAGLGTLCGKIAGNLEAFEFDDRDVYRAFHDTAEAAGLGELVERIEAGYLEESPGGGIHWLYRCSEIAGNEKLAQRPRPDLGPNRSDALIETRGEGGYIVLAPSGGPVHPSGRTYRLLRGNVATIATITPVERAALWQLARAFDEMPDATGDEPTIGTATNGAIRPGDDFNARATWPTILEPHGWELVRTSGDTEYWRRPDKDRGISATINGPKVKADRLYVFTSSTSFAPNRSYSKFAAYAVLNHAGDFTAAARELGRQGYGTPPQAGHNGATAAADASSNDAPEASGLPAIDAGDQHLPSVTAAAWAALHAYNNPPTLFRYGGLPVRIEEDEHGAPSPKTLTETRLRHDMARAADWYKRDRKGNASPALPPKHVIEDMLATPALPLPILNGILEAPAFAPDGTLHDVPGYHPAGRTYYHPSPGFQVPPVPCEPTAADIQRARGLIVDELLGDFPFTGDAERAHAVAVFLLPFVRGLIDGPTPLHLIEKPTPGTGASLLADVLSYPATGRPPAATTEGRDEDEWRKRLTAKLRTGAPIVLIDNLRRRLDSANVASALTSSVWEDRLLGTSDTTRLPVRCVWVATGNNPALSDEMTRRTIRIRLDARRDRPWLRTDFRHPNLRGWAAKHRGELVWAALTLAGAWLTAGRPVAPDAPMLGMYDSWSRVMGGILATAGIGGFLGNLDEFYDASDTEGAERRAFLGAWWDAYRDTPVPAAQLFAIATAPESTLPLDAKTEQGQRVQLGKILRELDGRVYPLDDGLTVRVERAGKHKHAVLWRLARFAGESGESRNSDSPGGFSHTDAENEHTERPSGESGESNAKRPREKTSQHNNNNAYRDSGGIDSPDSPSDTDEGMFSASGQRKRAGESEFRDSPIEDDWADL